MLTSLVESLNEVFRIVLWPTNPVSGRLSIPPEDMPSVLGYHARINRCAPQIDSEIVSGPNPCRLVYQYQGRRERFKYQTE